KLNRIFDGDDVVVVRLVDQVDDCREGRTLAAAGWSSDEYDAVFDIYYLFQYFGQVEIAEPRRSHRNHAHDDRVRAALFEDIYAKTRVTRSAERQVRGARFFKTINRRLLITDDQFGYSRSVGRRQFFQPRHPNRHEFAC